MVASWQSSNLTQPTQGSACIDLTLDFRTETLLHRDLTHSVEIGKLDFIQSVYIDNADNSAPLDLTFYGAPAPFRIRAAAFKQGWYAVAMPPGAVRFDAASNSGNRINVVFANFAMPYVETGPTDGLGIVPPLVNRAFAPTALIIGNNQLVPGVALQTIKLYRGSFNVDNPAVLKFTDGPGGAVLFSSFLTVGGSINFQVSGVPWFNTSAGNDLTLNSSAVVNLYGGFGVTQS